MLRPDLPELLEESALRKFITGYNRGKDNDRILKYDEATCRVEPSADRCCYTSIDDAGVRFRKGNRKGKYKKDRKFVEDTVIHIQSVNLQYTITSTGMRDTFKLLVTFLLGNGLIENHRLVFFTDGVVCIREYIEKFFGFRQFTVIPDRLHLKKKCNELLSMAIKGSKEGKGNIKRELVSRTWTGRGDKAIKFIESIKGVNVKSTGWLDRKKDL